MVEWQELYLHLVCVALHDPILVVHEQILVYEFTVDGHVPIVVVFVGIGGQLQAGIARWASMPTIAGVEYSLIYPDLPSPAAQVGDEDEWTEYEPHEQIGGVVARVLWVACLRF